MSEYESKEAVFNTPLAVVDRAYLLYEGEVLREGESSFLINDDVSKELYLGQEFSM